MVDFKIFKAHSDELFPGGELNKRLIIEEGCWYLCTDTAELFVGITTENGLTLKRINETEIHNIPVSDLAMKSDLESTKQEVIQAVAPEVESVKTTVETVLLPKVEEEIVPTITEVKSTTEELKAWVENKEFLQHIDLDGYASEDYVDDKFDSIEQNYVTNVVLANYTTTEQLQSTYVSKDNASELIAEEVATIVDEQIESKVAEVIQDKVDSGEIAVAADKITYGDFEYDII